jgi:DegV family protein with EDD domain
MSGTYHSALIAKTMVMQEFSDAQIEVIDSRTNCMAMGLTVMEAARVAQSGKSLEEAAQAARQMMNRIKFYFVPATLDYLKKGGRIGGAAALVGSILNLKPILYVANGKTAVLEKKRGTRAAIERLLNLLEDDYKAFGLKMVMVHHISCPDQAAELAQTIKNRYGLEVLISPIGPVIGLHVGPGTLSIIYCTETY